MEGRQIPGQQKTYPPPRGLSPAAAIARWQEQIPDLQARAEPGKIVVIGTLEQHELVEIIRRGGRVPEKTVAPDGPALKPLHLQRYTGTIETSLQVPSSRTWARNRKAD